MSNVPVATGVRSKTQALNLAVTSAVGMATFAVPKMNVGHRILLLLLVGFSVIGCASRRDHAMNSEPARDVPPDKEIILTPALSPIGRVLSVNLPARFVVLSYPIGQVPPSETRLNLYRSGAKVGELKVTGPQEDTLTVADITAGTAREGDQARTD